MVYCLMVAFHLNRNIPKLCNLPEVPFKISKPRFFPKLNAKPTKKTYIKFRVASQNSQHCYLPHIY